MSSSPPPFLRRLLAWILPPGRVRDGLLGDLDELYSERIRRGRISADLWYSRQLLSAAVQYPLRRLWARTFSDHPSPEPRRTEPPAGWLGIVSRDVRFGTRRLLASPVSTLTIIASLLIGIGVNTSIFSLADQVLVRALPVEDPDEIVQLRWDGRWIGEGRGWGSVLPHALYGELREEQAVFSAMAARSPGEVTLVTPAGHERAQAELVTGGYFAMLGITPFLGRLIGESDDRILRGHPVVVLSHAYWRSRMGADSSVVGRQIRLNGRPMTVVGVAPPGFYGTDWSVAPSVWLPMTMNSVVHAWGRLEERRIRFQHVYARLARGVRRARAEAAIQPWFRRYLRTDMERENWPLGLQQTEVSSYLASRLRVMPGGQGDAARKEELRQPVLVLSAATALLLLLACLNVANLSLARAVARRRESAVRRAIGASRGRIAVERLVEAGLLALVGAGAGVALAPVVGKWLLSYLEVSSSGSALDAGVDSRALLIAVGIAVVATLLSGIGPAWFDASAHPMGALKARSPGSAGGLRFRKVLVVAQVALALVLLAGAGLFGKSLHTLRSNGPRFSPAGLLTFTITPSHDGYSAGESRVVVEQVLDRVRSLPGVASAGVALWPMLEGSGWGNNMLVEGDSRFVTDISLPMNAVSPRFFETLSVPVSRGRDFNSSDRVDGSESETRSAIVSESFVERYLPGQDPLGIRIDFGRDPSRAARMEIVGVVADYHEHTLKDYRPQVYFPIWEQRIGGGTFYLRAQVATGSIAPAIREVVREIDPVLTVTSLRTVDEQIDRLLVFERMLAALGQAFALFGTLLATIGLYGVLTFAVESRTREVGIRLALGAPSRSATGLIVVEAVRLVVLGVTMALPVIWVLGRLVEGQLFGIEPTDPGAILGATAVLMVVCFAASAIPAFRMGRTSPLEALRVE